MIDVIAVTAFEATAFDLERREVTDAMKTINEIKEIEQRQICGDCVGEEYLGVQIRSHGDDGNCYYCDHDTRTIPVGELATEINTALESHYSRTPIDPEGYDYYLQKEGRWERAGDPILFIIAEVAEIDEAPAEDVRLVLDDRTYDFEMAKMADEGLYSEEAQYESKNLNDYHFDMGWMDFEEVVQKRSRFFSRLAADALDSIFGKINSLKTNNGDSVVVEAGPSREIDKLYRARVFQSDDDLERALVRPEQSLGPPPFRHAAAGRMNPHGISVFYGATSEETAIAEVRPPVGSKVAVGRFEIVRPIVLLDVSALRDVFVQGSVFDPGLLSRMEHAIFLERLSHQFGQPVMTSDEPFDYLITQIISDYLSEVLEPPLDGIIYGSPQTKDAGGNVVLFHPSSGVEQNQFPEGTILEAQLGYMTGDGYEVDYTVREKVPNPKPEPVNDPTAGLRSIPSEYGPFSASSTYDDRDVTLRLEVESVTIHHINSVAYVTHPFKVSRHSSVTGDEAF